MKKIELIYQYSFKTVFDMRIQMILKRSDIKIDIILCKRQCFYSVVSFYLLATVNTACQNSIKIRKELNETI